MTRETGQAAAPPRSFAQALRRTYLVERFLADLESRLVLVRAPAGFGKTEMLAAAWQRLGRRGERVAWVSATRGSSRADVAREIGRSLGVVDEEAAVVAALKSAGPEAPIHLFIDAAERFAEDAEPVGWLIGALSDGVRLAIAGQHLPPLHLSRLRMRGLLAEYDHGDLVLSRGEIQQMIGQRLRPEELDRLAETLAGWPGMVRLAAVALDRSRGPADRATLLDGRHGLMRDFVREEVFPSLTPREWALLRAIADLSDFTLEIAADLAGLPHDSETLRAIEALPPLIIEQAERVGWFRPHPVVAMAILTERQEDAEARRLRHRRAAGLFAERGLLEKAVLHASVAGDYDLAVRMIETAGGANLFLRAGYTVLQGIINAVPHEVVLATPSLRLCRAVMLAKSGLIREARAAIDGVAEEVRDGRILDHGALDVLLEHLSSLIDIYEDRGLDGAGIAALEAKVNDARREDTWRLGWVHNNLTIAYTRAGALEAAHVHALRALSLYQEERSSYPQVFMLIHLSFVNLRANRLEQALSYGRQAEALIRRRQWADVNLLAIARVPLASARYLQGNVAAARQTLERAMPLMAQGEGWVDFFAEGYGTLARARLAADGLAAALEAVEDGRAVADARDLPRLRLALGILQVELLTRAGRLEAARAVLGQLSPPASAETWPTLWEQGEARLAAARLALRLGQLAEASGLLETLGEECRRNGPTGLLHRVGLLRVEALLALKEPAAALMALEEAAELARTGELVQPARDEGQAVADAIRALVRRTGVSRLSPATADFIARIARGGEERGGDLLSPREMEVLRLLDAGLSNKAIARRMEVTEPTVKFHLKNLYAKLGVSRRTLALSVARSSGLLKGAD